MSPFSPKEIKQLFSHHNIRAKKYLGQNFLIDQSVIRKMLRASELDKDDVVIEIGPGLGALTQEIAPRVKKLIAIEKDREMVRLLGETLRNLSNVEIIQGDILNVQCSMFNFQKGYKVIANLPYYLTAPVIRKFLEITKVRPWIMVLMVQKEVAQRICAKPPRMNLLAVSVQFYATPKIMARVSKNSFWPSPRVDSAILKITPIIEIKEQTNTQKFFKVVKAGFSQPRKQLINNLSIGLGLQKADIESWLLQNNIKPTQRAETLTIQDWITLTHGVQ